MAEIVTSEVDKDLQKEILESGSKFGGKARKALMAKLEESGSDLGKAFEELDPAAKLWGRLVGRLSAYGAGNQQIEDAFSWYEVEANDGEKLDWRMRMMALFQAAELVDVDEDTYRACRKILVTLVQAKGHL